MEKRKFHTAFYKSISTPTGSSDLPNFSNYKINCFSTHGKLTNTVPYPTSKTIQNILYEYKHTNQQTNEKKESTNALRK